MKKRLSVVLLILSGFISGCDVPWQALTAVVAAATDNAALAIVATDFLDDDDDESWWENNDEHFEWRFWPFD